MISDAQTMRKLTTYIPVHVVTIYTQSAPDRRFGKFRCTAVEIGYSTAKYSEEKIFRYFMHMRAKTICGF